MQVFIPKYEQKWYLPKQTPVNSNFCQSKTFVLHYSYRECFQNCTAFCAALFLLVFPAAITPSPPTPPCTACALSLRSSYWSVVLVTEGTNRLGRFSTHQQRRMLSRTLAARQDISNSEQYSGGNRFTACFWTYCQTDCISERTLTFRHLFEGTCL